MKIVFPTDFSAAAENAYEYALKLAEQMNGTITVVHVYEVLEVHSWIEDATDMNALNEKITVGEFEKFKDQINILKRIAHERQLDHIDVNYALIESDEVVPAILQEAENHAADLLVMGTAGAHGLKELLFGSVASKVMESATCPVFVVPQTASFRGIEKVGLTLEYKEGELTLIEKGLAFAKRLGGHLHCIHVDVYDSAKEKATLATYQDAFQGDDRISFHVHHELDVEKGLLDFIKYNLLDVIIVGVHHKRKWSELFSVNISRKIAYHAEIPIIAIQNEVV